MSIRGPCGDGDLADRTAEPGDVLHHEHGVLAAALLAPASRSAGAPAAARECTSERAPQNSRTPVTSSSHHSSEQPGISMK